MNPAITQPFKSGLVETKVDCHQATGKCDFLSAEELTIHIHGCVFNDRLSQKKIYTSFYGYALTISDRYANNYDDAVEILNDGFLKIFKEIHCYRPAYADVVSSFKGWLRKIMINTAIDHFRKNHKHRLTKELGDEVIWVTAGGDDALDKISYEEIVRSIQKLTPGYRIIFNLFVVEGFSHDQISERLGISIGTSKSNLAKAKRQLQKILFQQYQTPLRPKIEKAKSSTLADLKN
jgi:RNA polymerase sigma-70 factor (ECF subfamily)